MWLKQLFSRRRLYSDLSEEIREHLEEKIEELVAGGMPRKEAAAVARREFGNVGLTEEDSRVVWRWQFIEEFVVDLRYGLRMLCKSPGFTAVVILTLALGIGANTTIFGVINATLLRELPFPNANRLVLLWETVGGARNWSIISAPNFWDYQRQSQSFEGLAIFDSGGRGYNLSPAGTKQEAEQVSGVRVSANFFPVLGVKPFLGRTFLSEEETLGKDHEVILSYHLWTRRYDGDVGNPTIRHRPLAAAEPATDSARADAAGIRLAGTFGKRERADRRAIRQFGQHFPLLGLAAGGEKLGATAKS